MRPDGTACLPYSSEGLREMYGVGPEEVREDATKVFVRHHPDDLPGLAASIEKSARDLSPWTHGARLIADDGSVRWLEGNSLPEREADGSILWHGFIADVTERKLAEDALRSLSHRLVQAGDEERRRIARELHDSTAQDLVAVLMNLGLLQDHLGSRDIIASQILADSAALLESVPGWTVCGEAGDGATAVELARKFQPDVVVLDISMPQLNGVEAARQIRKASPATEVLILTMADSESLLREVLEAGARGFILKTDTARLLIAAVESLAAHQPFFPGRVADLVLGGFLDPAQAGTRPGGAAGRLSPREREIAQLLAEAKTNKEVAQRLGVSVKTIDAHRANIMRKLNLHSVAELVRYAIREKLIEA